jgi:hypothetical protein
MAGNARQGVGNMPGNNNLIGKAMAKKGQTAGVAKNGAALKAGNVRQGNANAANAGAVKKANSPHANNPGNVLAARAVGGNLTRPVTSGKPGAPLAFNHVAKGNSGVNPARAMPTAAKKNVNSANAMTRLAVGHHFAGASVGHRAMPHAAALRRK